MAVADKKKIQTLINIAAEEVAKLKASATRLETLRAAFVAANPDVTGTALDGHVATVSTWIDDVRTVADAAVPNGLLANVVPSHRNKALGEL